MKFKLLFVIGVLLSVAFSVWAVDCDFGYTGTVGGLCCTPAEYISAFGGTGYYSCANRKGTLSATNECCYNPGVPMTSGGMIVWVRFDSIAPTTVELGKNISGIVSIKAYCPTNSVIDNTISVNFGDGNIVNLDICTCIATKGDEGGNYATCSSEFSYTYESLGDFTAIPKGGNTSGEGVTISVLERTTTEREPVKNPIKAGTIAEIIDKITDIAFYIFSGIALALFILGGIMIITAGGMPERIRKGKQAITMTLVGYAIILIAKGIVELVMKILTD